MNNVQLIGRISKDLEVKGQAEKAVLKFSVAVQRDYKNSQGQYDSDFINCVVFGKKAESIAKYFCKGKPIVIKNGSILTGSYDNKEGHKVYTTEVKINDFGFVLKDSTHVSEGYNTSNDNTESWSGEPIDEGLLPF